MKASHILRLARLAFPTISMKTTLLLSKDCSIFLLVPKRFHVSVSLYDFINKERLCFSNIEMHLNTFFFHGTHLSLDIKLAYDSEEDVCIVVKDSIQLFKMNGNAQGERVSVIQ